MELKNKNKWYVDKRTIQLIQCTMNNNKHVDVN